MAVNLTFDIADLVGTDFDQRRTKVWIETNIDGDVIIDATGNTIRLGDAKATVNADGTGSFTGLTATNAATNPTNFQYRAWIDYPKSGGREKWCSGWFSLTTTADLATVAASVYVPPTFRPWSWTGAWSSAAAYEVGNLVSYNGSSWLAKAASTNVTPTEGASWTLVAAKGDAGPTGSEGPPGATGAPGGSDASFAGWVSDTTPSQTRAALDSAFVNVGQAAGGDLAGTYPNPTIKSALLDPVAATAGLRTLGTGAQQAAAGNHNHSGTYEPVLTAGTTAQYYRGDKTWQTLNSSAVAGLGTSATKNIPAAGNAAATEVVYGTDTRLTDARTPTAHNHAATEITSGTIATARLGSGTASATTFLRGDNTWATPSGGGGSGLLASVTRAPATGGSYTTTSTAPVDVDAANLAATFTAPASGSVVVNLAGYGAGSGNFAVYWSLRSGSTNVATSERSMLYGALTLQLTARMLITGLTAGNSYTYKWAWRVSSASNTASLYYGGTEFAGNNGPLTMEVWSA